VERPALEVRGRHPEHRRRDRLGAAVDYLQALGLATVRAHDIALTAYALERLAGIENLEIQGPLDARNARQCDLVHAGARIPRYRLDRR